MIREEKEKTRQLDEARFAAEKEVINANNKAASEKM